MTMTTTCKKCGKHIIISRNNFSGEWSDKDLDKCECDTQYGSSGKYGEKDDK